MDHLPGLFQQLLRSGTSAPVLLVLIIFSFLVTGLILRLGQSRLGESALPSNRTLGLGMQSVLAAGCFAYFFISGQMALGLWKTFETRSPNYLSAQCVRTKMADDGLIVASGGVCTDGGGHRVANNAPDMFYWLGRKGFSTCQGHESVSQLTGLAAEGAKYFVADKASLNEQPGLEEALRRSFYVSADCKTVLLFALHSIQQPSPDKH